MVKIQYTYKHLKRFFGKAFFLLGTSIILFFITAISFGVQQISLKIITIFCLIILSHLLLIATVYFARRIVRLTMFPSRSLSLYFWKKRTKHIHQMFVISAAVLLWYENLAVVILVIAYTFYFPVGLSTAFYLLRRDRLEQKVLNTFEGCNFDVVVHVSGTPRAAYQINQWLPVLELISARVCIISRKSPILNKIGSTSIPIFYARGHKQLSDLLNRGPRVVLYVSNNIENVQAFRQIHLKHVFINHGDSDKMVNQNKMILCYDKLFLAGNLAYRRLTHNSIKVRTEQIEFVGRPQLALHLNNENTSSSPLIRKVLYAPTFEGLGEEVNYTSLTENSVDLFNLLMNAYPEMEIMYKPHPFTGKRSKEVKTYSMQIQNLLKSKEMTVLGNADSLYDALNWCDLLITDISSVLNEFLYTNKPIIMITENDISSEDFPSTRAAYKVSSGNQLIQMINDIQTNDELSEVRQEIKKESFGEFEGGSIRRFDAAINGLLQ